MKVRGEKKGNSTTDFSRLFIKSDFYINVKVKYYIT